ncbi:MAG: hypothetical protein Q9209_004303 [Squamulea sp. 1 TL-2023]
MASNAGKEPFSEQGSQASGLDPQVLPASVQSIVSNLPLANKQQHTHMHLDGLENQPFKESVSKSWNNPKKRPSASTLLEHEEDADQRTSTQLERGNGAEPHPQKRSRAADWPLRSTDESSTSVITHRPTQKSPISPIQRRNLARTARSSKFLEGSMNDRVSKKPPSIYLRDEEAMDRFHDQASTHESDSHNASVMNEDKTYYNASVETTKPSGMYRFGKALASAFKPVNFWQGINGYWKVKDEQKQPNMNILQERKLKAERTYAEMKKNGFKGTQPFAFRGSSIDGSSFSERTSHDHSLNSSFRDSGVDFDEQLPLIISKKQRIPAGSEDMLIATSLLRSRRAVSPIPQEEIGHKTSLNLSRPSLQGLKKAKSHFNLSASKRKVADAALLSPDFASLSESNVKQRLTRQASKKDIAKQRKLSKQVSDLESKLKAARRELELSRGQVPDPSRVPKSGRKTFNKPGALPSLPSEPFLNPTEESFQTESDSEWKPSTSYRSRQRSNGTPKRSATKATATQITPSKQVGRKEIAPTSSNKKRKLSGGRVRDKSYKPGQSTDNGSDSDRCASVRRPSRTCKAQERGAFMSVDNETTSKHLSIGAFKGTRCLPTKSQPAVPPLPALNTQFDPAKVDKQKLLAMRSVPKDGLPFGSHLDDIVNLQKEYPHTGQKLLDEYLSSLSKTENPSPSPTSLIKPARSEDMSTRTRQVCKSSSSNRLGAKNLSTIDEAIMVDPSKDKSIPPLPRSPMKDTSNPTITRTTTGKTTNKPLPEILKEDYKWPEDVF